MQGSTPELHRSAVALRSISLYLGQTHTIHSNVGESLSMQYRVKSSLCKWVSLTFEGVEPNLGIWPETPTGLCWPWSRHRDGQLLTVPCSTLWFCSVPETLHQSHTFPWTKGRCPATCPRLLPEAGEQQAATLPRADWYSAIRSLSWKHDTA